MDALAAPSRHYSFNRWDAGHRFPRSSGCSRHRTTDRQSSEEDRLHPFSRLADRFVDNRCHASLPGLDEQLWAAAVFALEWTLVLWRPGIHHRSLHLVVAWRGLLPPNEQNEIADAELGDSRIRNRNAYRVCRVAKWC